MNAEGCLRSPSRLRHLFGDSDNISCLQHHSDITNGRNINLLGGGSDSAHLWQGGNSDMEKSSLPDFLGSTWGDCKIHISRCLISTSES